MLFFLNVFTPTEVGIFKWTTINLECLILISDVSTFKLEMLDPKIKVIRVGYDQTGDIEVELNYATNMNI